MISFMCFNPLNTNDSSTLNDIHCLLSVANEDICDMSYTQWQSQSFTASSETPLTKMVSRSVFIK